MCLPFRARVSVQDFLSIPQGADVLSVETLSISHEAGSSVFCQVLD